MRCPAYSDLKKTRHNLFVKNYRQLFNRRFRSTKKFDRPISTADMVLFHQNGRINE